MKIRITWSTAIVLSILAFMIFILSFVYKSIAIEDYHHELVSEDYYKDELHYQEEIDKIENASKLEKNIELKTTEQGLWILFPESMDPSKINGTVSILRFSNKKLDIVEKIVLDQNKMLIPKDRLVKGKWEVKIDWSYDDQAYMYKDSWFY